MCAASLLGAHSNSHSHLRPACTVSCLHQCQQGRSARPEASLCSAVVQPCCSEVDVAACLLHACLAPCRLVCGGVSQQRGPCRPASRQAVSYNPSEGCRRGFLLAECRGWTGSELWAWAMPDSRRLHCSGCLSCCAPSASLCPAHAPACNPPCAAACPSCTAAWHIGTLSPSILRRPQILHQDGAGSRCCGHPGEAGVQLAWDCGNVLHPP